MAGGWGSGYRGTGNRGGTAVSGSRFSVLSEEPRQQTQNGFGFGGGRSSGGSGSFGQQSAQQGGRGRGRGGPAPQKPHWKDVVRSDDAGERPPWRLTCYAHERSGENDLAGDTSFEELRWAQQQTATAGATPQQIAAAETAMFAAHDSRWQQLLLAARPPSLGGATIGLPNTGFTAAAAQPGGFPQPMQAASGFGSAQFAQAAPSGTAFAPASGSFGGVNSPARPLGGGGFGNSGGGFGSRVFGSGQPKRVVAFGGGGAAAPNQLFGVQQQQQSSFGTAFGAGFGSQPAFGEQQRQGTKSIATPGPFQAQAVPTADHPGAAAESTNSDVGTAADATDPWLAPKFTRGMIPEDPPD